NWVSIMDDALLTDAAIARVAVRGLADGGRADEVTTVDEVAGEVVVASGSGEYNDKQTRHYPAATLLTNEFLRGRPQVFVAPGRVPLPKTEPEEEVTRVRGGRGRGNADGEGGGGEGEGPPRLSDPDGSYATPSMKPLFKMYRDASLRKADTFIQTASSSTSTAAQSIPAEEVEEEEEQRGQEEEEGEETVHQIDDQTVAGEELEQLIDESQVMGEVEETIQHKEELFFEDVVEDGQHEVVYEMAELGWPAYSERAIDFAEACDLVLGNTRIPDEKVCKSAPHGFKDIGSFVVDLAGLPDRHEVMVDGFGSWGKPSGRTRFYHMDRDANKYVCVSDARGQLPKGVAYDAKCQLRKYEHPTTAMLNNGANRFIKKIITCVWRDQQQSQLAIVTYEWVGTPFDFTFLQNEPRRTRGFAPMPPDGARNWEAASFQASSFSSFPATCTATIGGCPVYSFGAIQFQDVCHIIMGATNIDSMKVCDRVPQGFRECGTFVIDVESLGSELELRRDDNGQWGKPAGNSRYFKMDGNTATRLDKSGRLERGQAYDLQVLCKRYEHPLTSNRFVRKIYTGRVPFDKDYHQASTLAVITYFWKGDPIPFDVVPQRKVRVHDASDYETMKRSGRMPSVYEDDLADEENMVMEEEGRARGGGGGVGLYMETDSALVDDPMPMRMPPRKRKKSEGASMAAERASLQQAAAAGLPSAEDVELRKMALANQQVLSTMLDRFGSLLEKMERAADMQMNMMWRASRQFATEETRDRPEGEVQYVEEEVYEMEGE
ncbi:hypothetical protein PFISCL1PPCAC_4770, partial [Pristionchus fissidentatus]